MLLPPPALRAGKTRKKRNVLRPVALKSALSGSAPPFCPYFSAKDLYYIAETESDNRDSYVKSASKINGSTTSLQAEIAKNYLKREFLGHQLVKKSPLR
jgi:hypothetical protein